MGTSNNGPQLSNKEFDDCGKSDGFIQITSLIYYPQEKGHTEKTVRTEENCFRKARDPYKAIIENKNTNIE
jgi:hypothetical protein